MEVVGEIPPSVDWGTVPRRPQPERRAVQAAAHPAAPVHPRVLVALGAAGRDALTGAEVWQEMFLLLLLVVLQPDDVVLHQHGVVLQEGMVGGGGGAGHRKGDGGGGRGRGQSPGGGGAGQAGGVDGGQGDEGRGQRGLEVRRDLQVNEGSLAARQVGHHGVRARTAERNLVGLRYVSPGNSQ